MLPEVDTHHTHIGVHRETWTRMLTTAFYNSPKLEIAPMPISNRLYKVTQVNIIQQRQLANSNDVVESYQYNGEQRKLDTKEYTLTLSSKWTK